MTKIVFTSLLVFCVSATIAQQAYYNDVDLTLTGQDLYLELQNKIDDADDNFTYGEVRDTVKITDEDPDNFNNVLLVYGYSDDSNCTTDRTRDKDDFGGSVCEYNREHVFARSNANPTMGNADNSSTGIVADPHNIRSSDQVMNGARGNRKFAAGSGNAGNTGSNWYPGDEWKGDIARMMMYMYTRYGNRCLPSLNGSGATQSGNDMLQIYLQWNIEDPVSDFEDQRNPYLENAYGNRNPFIDNPYLATIIWGGEPAEDRWNLFSTDDFSFDELVVYPNPVDDVLWIESRTSFSSEGQVVIYDILGKRLLERSLETASINVSHLPEGLYLIEVSDLNKRAVKKIMIH